MSLLVLDHASRRLARNVALVLIAGLGAGCSSDVLRFQDGFYTGSVSPRPTTMSRSAAQPYPGSVDGGYTGSVTSSGIQSSALPPVSTPPGYPAQSSDRSSPRPSANVPSGGYAAASSYPAAPAPSYSSPQGAAQNSRYQQAGTYHAALAPVAATPGRTHEAAATSAKTSRVASMEADRNEQLPTPRSEPRHTVAVLPKAPELREGKKLASDGTANASMAPSQQSGSANGTYTVAAGDSLYSISRRTGASVDAIKQANGLSNGFLRAGQTLTIPGAGNTRVASAAPQPAAPQPAAQQPKPAAPARVDPVVTATARPEQDSAKPAGYTPPQPSATTVVASTGPDDDNAPSASGIAQMRWPVRGRVLAKFGDHLPSGRNDGIDIMVPEGTPVKAAENGVVIYAGDGLKEFGNTVLVRHEDGLVTVYGHVGAISVSRGQTVHRGQEIARSGMTGNATVPELHFEVRKNAKPVDPVGFLDRAAG